MQYVYPRLLPVPELSPHALSTAVKVLRDTEDFLERGVHDRWDHNRHRYICHAFDEAAVRNVVSKHPLNRQVQHYIQACIHRDRRGANSDGDDVFHCWFMAANELEHMTGLSFYQLVQESRHTWLRQIIHHFEKELS
jgi:hypothetical protein